MSAPVTVPVLVARQRAQDEPAPSPGALLDQRHQLLDLDPDSRFDYPGACCVNCPPREGAQL
ncbi:hypothetical protein OG539_32540 [Actinacidiphila glaucinigra]|uniref:hypothetical protein n=1 Tax=Actinacidiphila glaucinigra TaxID=235986 RepID=UPI0032506D78